MILTASNNCYFLSQHDETMTNDQITLKASVPTGSIKLRKYQPDQYIDR